MKLIHSLISFVLLFSISTWAYEKPEDKKTPNIAPFVSKQLKRLHVQDGGRIKPYSTFARESLQLVYGKSKYNGRSAEEIVFTWLLVPDHWLQEPVFQVRHSGLREALGFKEKKQIYHSANEFLESGRLQVLLSELKAKQEAGEKLNPYYQAIQTLNNQLSSFHSIRFRQRPNLVPPPPGSESDQWLPITQTSGLVAEKFKAMATGFVAVIGSPDEQTQLKALKDLDGLVGDFAAAAKAQNPEAYGSESVIEAEVHLTTFEPFKWSWVLYVLCSIFLMAFITNRKDRYAKISWVFLGFAIALHIYGLALRVYITGRPPVSNMYETVVWVPLCAVFFALILHKVRGNHLLVLSSTLISALCLLLTDLAPVVLDPTLQPLEPVLRDNFWLVTHVIIIVASYGAFFLAFVLGDILLYYYLKDEKKYQKQIKEGVHAIYRSLQIGVVLLALGTILGGIWADYSWGRFWGWDPKETWALIALLGYLAILHGRLIGWVRDFGMAVWSIVSFSLVIMCWYGVNFVLGAGLHTYGFGAGGVEYVSVFVAIHLVYVGFVAAVRHGRLKQAK